MNDQNLSHDRDMTQALIDACWDFHDAASSEARFAGLLSDPSLPLANRIEFQTQLARATGLQGRFDRAQQILDDASATLTDRMDRPRIRIALERGRVLNSSGDRESSRPQFNAAWDLATQSGCDDLAIDAAHMLAIVHDDSAASEWLDRAMNLCQSSADPVARRWRASLLNNAAWMAHERNDFQRALELFEQALSARVERGAPREIQIAMWSVARALRSLSRCEEALAIQKALAAGPAPDDGYVHEEIAACLTALGRAQEAAPHAQRSEELLQK